MSNEFFGPGAPISVLAKPRDPFRSLLALLRYARHWRGGFRRAVFLDNLFDSVLFDSSASISSLYGGGAWKIGGGSLVGAALVCETPMARIEVGSHCYLSPGVALVSANRITIGDRALIARNVTIQDNDSHSLNWKVREKDVELTIARHKGVPSATKDFSLVPSSPVEIGNNVWIGMSAILLKGVRIGNRAIIGAGSVVTHDILDDTFAAGNPAREIRRLIQV